MERDKTVTLDQLRYFVETALHQHVSKAARILNVSPSAISHAIAKLEDELGQKLFFKVGTRIRLTKAGEQLTEEAKNLLDHANQLHSRFSKQHSELKGLYRLAATPVLCEHLLVKAWARMQTNYPLLLCDLKSEKSADVVDGVVSGNTDAGLCFSPLANSRLHSTVVFTGNLVPVVSSKHPQLKLKGSNISKLSEYPVAAARAHQGIDVCEHHPALEKYNLKQKPIFLFDSYQSALSYIECSEAWGLVPDIIPKLTKWKVKPVPIPRNWESRYSINFLTEANRQDCAVFACLLKNIREQINNLL